MFCVGLIIGGLFTSMILYVLNRLFSPLPALGAGVLLLAACLSALLREFEVVAFPLPENQRLIPRNVFENQPVRGAGQFGLELGTGLRTFVPATSPYLLALAMVLIAPGAVAAIACGVGFGAGRTTALLARNASRRVEGWDELLGRRIRTIRQAAICVTVLGLAACLATPV